MSEMKQGCLICGGDPACIALFFPKNPEPWGAPAGKQRVYLYSLCERCFGKPDKAAIVEKIIWGEITEGGKTWTSQVAN